MQREHVLLATEIGQLAPALTIPIFAFASDSLAVVFGELLERSLRLEEHLSLAIDRPFAFFEQRSHAVELRLPQAYDRFALFQLAAHALRFTAEVVLSRFDFLPCLCEVFLLESQAVFEDRAFVPQFGQLLLALPSKRFLGLEQARFLSLFRGIQFGELRLSLGEQFLTHASDGRLLNFTRVFEFCPFAVALRDEVGSLALEFVALAKQRVSFGPQLRREYLFGYDFADMRLCGLDFLQLELECLFQTLPLLLELHLAALSVQVGSRDRLLQAFSLGDDLCADVGHQPDAIRFELLAAIGKACLFSTKLFDGVLLRGDLFGERRLTLPQGNFFRQQLLIGLLLPLPQVTALVFDLLKLRRQNLVAPL